MKIIDGRSRFDSALSPFLSLPELSMANYRVEEEAELKCTFT